MSERSKGRWLRIWLGAATALAAPAALSGQTVRESTPLDELLDVALQANTEVMAMEARVAAFEARIDPAGAWDDPQLVLGVMNLPLPSLDFDGTPMTQALTVQLRQGVPFPGKTGLRTGIASAEHATAAAEAADTRLAIVNAVRAAYYELYTLERSLEITERHQALLEDFVRVANARYTVGSGLQQDVLKSNVELTQLRERWLEQDARRQATMAQLNALLDRPPETPVEAPALPAPVVRLALGLADTAAARFASSQAGAPDVPSLRALIDSAIATRPLLAAHRTAVRRQELSARLAERSVWPDLMFSVGYGHRGAGLEDFFSASIGLNLPVFAGRKQNRLIDAARAAQVQADAAYREAVNRLSARLARLRSDLTRQREQLTLYRDGILPQATAALQSATSAYQVGRVDFLTLVNNQATLYRYELDYHRLLAAFASTASEIERTVGKEIFDR